LQSFIKSYVPFESRQSRLAENLGLQMVPHMLQTFKTKNPFKLPTTPPVK